MDEVTTTTMTVPPPLSTKSQTREPSLAAARQTVSIRTISPPSVPSEAGATVFVGGSAPADPAPTWRIPEVQSTNGFETQSSRAAHVVKIKIDPAGEENGKVISTVRLTVDEHGKDRKAVRDSAVVVVSATNVVNNENQRGSAGEEGCVRISVGAGNEEMVHRGTSETLNSSNACFYYGSFQNPLGTMVMSSGQCSPSDTLDSGTCSDLDGTPPPLPKKKSSSSTVILGGGQHVRTGSLTSSGAEADSDDNESNISCDSLNSGDLGVVSVVRNASPTLVKTDQHPERGDASSKTRLGSKEEEEEASGTQDVREVTSKLECASLNGRNIVIGYSSSSSSSSSTRILLIR